MKNAERLDTASSFFFFFGFVVSQLQHSPFVLIAALSNLAALFFYSIGYGLWLVACQLYPDYPRQKDRWYGFTEVKNQHRAAAALGAAAIICCIVGIFLPVALVAASWLFFVSNCIWSIAEYHKQQNPFSEGQNHSSSQVSYVQYTIITTLMALVPAVAATISLFFPPAALIVFIASTTLGITLGSVAFYCWLDYTLDQLEASDSKESYDTLTQQLEIRAVSNQVHASLSPGEQPTYPSLWKTNSFSPEAINSSTLFDKSTSPNNL